MYIILLITGNHSSNQILILTMQIRGLSAWLTLDKHQFTVCERMFYFCLFLFLLYL